MNNNILKWRRRWTPGAFLSRESKTPHLLKGMEFVILVDHYDVVIPFGREGQEGPPQLPPEPLFDHMRIIKQISLRVFKAFLPLVLGSSGGN